MHYEKIKRRCGHEETIGIAGGYGDMTDISKERAKEMIDNYEQTTANNIKEAEAKLCIDCLMALSHDDRKKEMQVNGIKP
jgi:hypothetical protein